MSDGGVTRATILSDDELDRSAALIAELERRPGHRWRNRRTAVIAAVFAAVAFALRVGELGPATLWVDDAWVMVAAQENNPLQLLRWSVTTPGFFFLVKAVQLAFGHDTTAAQTIPFIAGVVAVPATFLTGRRLGLSTGFASVAAAMVLVSPEHLVHSTRVKQYTLEVVFVLAMLWLGARALERIHDPRRWRDFVAVAACATILSASVAPVVGAVIASGLFMSRRSAPARRIVLRAAALYGAGAALWYLIVLRPNVHDALHDFWIDYYIGSPADLWRLGGEMLAGFSPMPVGITATLVIASAVIVLRYRTPVGIALCLPTLAAVAMSTLGLAPFGGGRTDIFGYPALALLIGAAGTLVADRIDPADPLVAEAAPGRGARRTMTGRLGPRHVLVAVALVATVAWGEMPRQYPVEDVATLVDIYAAERVDGDTMVVTGRSHYAVGLYGPSEWRFVQDDNTLNNFYLAFEDPITTANRIDGEPLVAPERFLEWSGDFERVWFLSSDDRGPDYYDRFDVTLGDIGFTLTEEFEAPGARMALWSRTNR